MKNSVGGLAALASYGSYHQIKVPNCNQMIHIYIKSINGHVVKYLVVNPFTSISIREKDSGVCRQQPFVKVSFAYI